MLARVLLLVLILINAASVYLLESDGKFQREEVTYTNYDVAFANG